MLRHCWCARIARARVDALGKGPVTMERQDSRLNALPLENRAPNVQEIRLIADLRFMHNRVLELIAFVDELKSRHDVGEIVKYADEPLLLLDIQRVDHAYQYYLDLKEELERRKI
jgi:hypothetical protein